MEDKNKLGTIVDGIGASEHLDSSGEVLDIKGMDISSLGSADSILNFEHGSKDNPAQVCGKVTFAKKIFKKSDCDNERQEYFWNICKKPFVYVKGELFDHPSLDHDGARNVAALLRYDNRDKGKKARRLISFSIEGGKMDKQGMVVKKSIARDLALTIKHCNKMCIAEILDDIKDRRDLYKGEENRSSRNVIIEEMKKSLPSRKDFKASVDKFKETKSFKQKQDVSDNITKLATKPISKPSEAKPKREFTPQNAPSTMKVGDRIKYDKPKARTGKDIYNDPDTWKSENNMRKAITAGIMNAAPSALSGGAALASEELLGQKEDLTKSKKKDKKLKKAEFKKEPQPHDIIEVHPKKFHARVNKFRELNDMNRANVHPYSHEDYSKMKTYMTRDGKSGYAVKNGNELVSVHSSERGRGDHLVSHAVKMGAKKLDAYDIGGKLPKLYGKHGFQEKGRYGFDPQYADPTNKLLHGHKPDFVEMSIPDKPDKMQKMSQPNMAFPKMGIENRPDMSVKTIDPDKKFKNKKGKEFSQTDIERRKIENKYVQGQKKQAGASKLADFDDESVEYINEQKKDYGKGLDPKTTKGVNVVSTNYNINEAYDYSGGQSKEKMAQTKGRGNYPSTKHHEGLHQTLTSVAQKTSNSHSKNLVRHIMDNFFDKNNVKGVSDYVGLNYDKKDPHLKEEHLTHILDLLTNKDKRNDHNEHFVNGKVGDIDYKQLKQGWKNAVKFTRGLDEKKLNEINDFYNKKDKQSKKKKVVIEKIPPGGYK